MHEVSESWTLAILAGGFSRRFGRDKADAALGGAGLLDHAVQRFGRGAREILVATRPDGPGRDRGLRCVFDDVPGAGPLAGTAAVLRASTTAWTLIVPCDAPLLPPSLPRVMLAASADVDAVVLSSGGFLQPLPLLLARSMAGRLERLVREGARRMDAWRCAGSFRVLPFETAFSGERPEQALLNVNTEADLAMAERWLLDRGAARPSEVAIR